MRYNISMSENMKTRPTVEEMTTEQPHRTDAAYVAAVNEGLAKARAEIASGKKLTGDKFWSVFRK